MNGAPSRVAAHHTLYKEVARIVRAMIENVVAVSPLPGGSSLFAVEVTDQFLDRVAVWGAEIEDDEPDPDLEPDSRDLPLAGAVPSYV